MTADEFWFSCCEHCECLDHEGHDDTCNKGCNDDEMED